VHVALCWLEPGLTHPRAAQLNSGQNKYGYFDHVDYNFLDRNSSSTAVADDIILSGVLTFMPQKNVSARPPVHSRALPRDRPRALPTTRSKDINVRPFSIIDVLDWISSFILVIQVRPCHSRPPPASIPLAQPPPALFCELSTVVTALPRTHARS
jgi:hypothetical protein